MRATGTSDPTHRLASDPGVVARGLGTGLAVVVPVVLVGAPLATLVATATSVPLADLARVLGRLNLPALFGNVAVLGVLATLWAVVGAVPLAWLAARTDLPGRALVRGVVPVTLAVPPYVIALAYVALLAPGGAVHRALAATLEVPLALFRWPPVVFGTGGAAFILGVAGVPSVFLFVHGALERANPSLEDAARSLGLGPVATFCRVTLPMLRAPLLAGSLLVFLYACVDFGVVSLVRARTVTTVLFTYLENGFAPHASAAIALTLVVVLWGVLAVQRQAMRVGVGGTSTGNGIDGLVVLADPRGRQGARPVRLGRWRLVAVAYVVFVASIGLAVPLVTLVALAASLGIVPLVTFWAAQVNRVTHTLEVGFATATLVTIGGLALALARGARGRRAVALAIGAAQAGYAIPGTILALAVVGLISRFLPWIDGGSGVVVVVVAILVLAPAIQSTATALDTVPRVLLDAARGLGESPAGAFLRVGLPLAGPALLSGWALAFGLAARELAATLIVRPPGYDTLAVRIWVHTTDVGPDPHAAAVALLLLAVLGATWVTSQWLGRRHGPAA